MSPVINAVATADLDALLQLNESEVPHVGSINIEEMRWFAQNADYFRVARIDGAIAGFLIGLQPGSSYQSPNYRWFCEQYSEFGYVDRIAVTAAARGHGVASTLYDDFAASLPDSTRVMTCEVNILPPNEGSMRFHERIGFHQVGTMSSAGGDKKVAFLLKGL